MGIIFNNNGKKSNLFIGDLFMVWNNAKNHVHLQWPLFQLNFKVKLPGRYGFCPHFRVQYSDTWGDKINLPDKNPESTQDLPHSTTSSILPLTIESEFLIVNALICTSLLINPGGDITMLHDVHLQTQTGFVNGERHQCLIWICTNERLIYFW